jgi:hypothetical protein
LKLDEIVESDTLVPVVDQSSGACVCAGPLEVPFFGGRGDAERFQGTSECANHVRFSDPGAVVLQTLSCDDPSSRLCCDAAMEYCLEAKVVLQEISADASADMVVLTAGSDDAGSEDPLLQDIAADGHL